MKNKENDLNTSDLEKFVNSQVKKEKYGTTKI